MTSSSPRAPRAYGVPGQRPLANLYGGALAQWPAPASALTAPISDTLSSLQAQNQQRQNTIAPAPAPQGSLSGALSAPQFPSSGSASGPVALAQPPGQQSTADASAAWRLGNASSATSTPPAGSSTGTDRSADPILTQIKALGARSYQTASAGALAGSKNDLINDGSTQVPQTLRDLFSTSTRRLIRSSAISGRTRFSRRLNTAANNLASLLGNENQSLLGALTGAHDQCVNALSRAPASGSGAPATTPPPRS